MCMNGLLVVMAFGPFLGLWPSSFFVLLRDHGSRRNISENVQFPAKIQHAPKLVKTCKNEVPLEYMCKHENDQ